MSDELLNYFSELREKHGEKLSFLIEGLLMFGAGWLIGYLLMVLLELERNRILPH